MRHGNTINKLSRTHSHRKALMSNMANSLILHKRMVTTLAKAKSLRRYVEPLLTKSKTDDTHNRRVVFSYLQQKEVLKELFGVVAPKIADRPGGYTRILKLGPRQGDNTEMALIELVDFNEYLVSEPGKGAKSRRTRRGKKKGGPEGAAPVASAPAVVTPAEPEALAIPEEVIPAEAVAAVAEVEAVVAEAPVAEAPVAEVEAVVAEVASAEVPEVEAAEAPVAEAPAASTDEAPKPEA